MTAAPTGLAEYTGFKKHTLLDGYGFPSGGHPTLGYLLSALVGILIVGVAVFLIAVLVGAPSLGRWFQMDHRCTPGPHRAIAPLARPCRSTMSSARSGGPGRTDWLQGAPESADQ